MRAEPTAVSDLPLSALERWALAYVLAEDYETKLAPAPMPQELLVTGRAAVPASPGRGPEFAISEHGERSTGRVRLGEERRIRLVHTFLHHELQAAELMLWALLKFPAAPPEVVRGLLSVFRDEIRHMNLYAAYLQRHGSRPGAFPVRDWFWERIPECQTLPSFLATMGMGFEGANLDHATRFAARFRQAGDHDGADLQELVAREEVAHVRFALRWFCELSPEVQAGQPLFDAFCRALPEPLSPILMRGKPQCDALRRRAGFPDDFLDELKRYDGG